MCPLYEFCGDITRFITLGVLFQKIGEEEHFQDGKDDKQLNEDDRPQVANIRYFLITSK